MMPGWGGVGDKVQIVRDELHRLKTIEAAARVWDGGRTTATEQALTRALQRRNAA